MTDQTNSHGRPVIDPTANVLSLVGAARQRQDDLRMASDKRNDDIRKMEEHCRNEVSTLQEKLRLAESVRLNAVNLAERGRVDSRFQDIIPNAALLAERTGVTDRKSVV